MLENRSIVGNNHEYNVAILQHQVKNDAKLNLTKSFKKSVNAAKATKRFAKGIASQMSKMSADMRSDLVTPNGIPKLNIMTRGASSI